MHCVCHNVVEVLQFADRDFHSNFELRVVPVLRSSEQFGSCMQLLQSTICVLPPPFLFPYTTPYIKASACKHRSSAVESVLHAVEREKKSLKFSLSSKGRRAGPGDADKTLKRNPACRWNACATMQPSVNPLQCAALSVKLNY